MNKDKTYKQVIAKFPVLCYILTAFSVTWGIKLLYVFVKSNYGMPQYNFGLIASFGPAISALILIRMSEGSEGVFRILKNVVDLSPGIKWILLAALFEPFMFFSITVVYSIAGGSIPVTGSFRVQQGIVSYIIAFTAGLFMWGFSEETGWRGWMLPKLQMKTNPFYASLILSVIVSLWHLNPVDFASQFTVKEGEYLYGMYPGIVERLIITIPVTMVITFIYNKTGGSLFLMMLFHSASNTSYFWIDGAFGVVKTDFFRISFLAELAIIFFIFTLLLIKQRIIVTANQIS